MKCNLCPRQCNIDRDRMDGACHADNTMRISRIAPHFFEEPIISGERGSGTVFFSGCNLDCCFCQNHQISKNKVGRPYTPTELADALRTLEKQGVHNINFVTPTHFSHKIEETLKIYRPRIPIVYNTSGYECRETLHKICAFSDIFLTDLKYAVNETGKKYSGVANYATVAIDAIDEMVNNKPLVYSEDGMLMQGVIVRHLVLPSEMDNSMRAVQIFAERWKDRAILSLMSQFFPTYKSLIKRVLKPIEYKIILNEVSKNQIENCFYQELSSAKKEYVPDFEV